MILKRWRMLLISISFAMLSVGFLLQQSAAFQIESELSTTVDTDEMDEMERVIVRLSSPSLPHRTPDMAELAQRTAVIHHLQQTAVSSQASLINQLEMWTIEGHVSSHHSLWIINAVVVTGTTEVIADIAKRADVEAVLPDEQHRYFEPTDKLGEMLNSQQLTANNQQLTINSQSPTWGVERIGAPAIWHGLGIDGGGVTIAIMDSGTDWLHPDLLPNYRGNLGGGVYEHDGNWYHTSNPTATAPIDLLGHGTHVAGTAVGQNGIGVAPGANWIAVSVADEYGFIYESDVHSGFQWLMAPAGDPALAPDIVNNSWGGSPYAITFLDDVLALQAAAIIPVFAAGNNGPFPETVGSPASYTSTLSVAASDDIDEIAWFSSRGPSPLTTAQNPWIAAPGTATYSSLPDGEYGFYNGTSMATPHVVGAMALLLQANPTFTQQEMMDVMAQTAVSISTTHPNDDSGWGRLNAYAAVASQVHSGMLEGVVRGDGQPLADVAVVITMTNGVTVAFQTDENGRYHADVRAGLYSVATEPFGYENASASGLPVIVNQTTIHDFDLTRLPSGTIMGVVRDADTNEPLNAIISVQGAPATATTDVNGRYTLTLPANSYQLIAAADSHRLGRADVVVNVGETAVFDFSLAPGQSVLLVDGGHWYFNSKASYYQESLADLDYNIDTWTIRTPLNGAPTLADLEPYDTVIWSNPLDSPGYIGAGGVISDYLGLDKNLLISGQHVGAYDGDSWWLEWWWYGLLDADWMGKTSVSSTITGTNAFTGLNPVLNGAGSAENQTQPDQSRPRTGTLTQPAFVYDDGLSAGLQAGHCEPFRIVYTGFGLEGVMAGERADIIERSFDYFESPRLTTGTQWEEDDINDFAIPATQLSYTLTLRNLSETVTDTFDLSINNASWPTTLMTTTLTLGSCELGQTVVIIDVPADAPSDFVHEIEIVATSRNAPSINVAASLRHKISGHILLVDDDRWYDQQAVYMAMLDEMNLNYDVWDIAGNKGGTKRGSPPLEILNRYDIVLWYTAYDWFRPITPAENADLAAFLAQGGRLFLTSQDFLYYNENTELARRYFGVMDYKESVEPVLIYGAADQVLPLEWSPYQNNGDGVIPVNKRPFLFSEKGMGIGTMTADDGWRTAFLGFPLEKLPTANHAPIMNRVVGWLSDLGDTTFTVDAPTGAVGVPRTYTITLRNDPSAPANQVVITNTLPASLTLQIGTVTGGAAYNAITRELTWNGMMDGGAVHGISYEAIPAAGVMENELEIYYDRHRLMFNKTAVLSINSPNMSNSTLTAISNSPSPTPILTYTLRLVNDGQQAAIGATAVLTFSEPLTMVVGSLTTTLGITAVFTDHIEWTGDLSSGAIATVTVGLERGLALTKWTLPATAVLDDRETAVTILYNQLEIRPFVQFLPLVSK